LCRARAWRARQGGPGAGACEREKSQAGRERGYGEAGVWQQAVWRQASKAADHSKIEQISSSRIGKNKCEKNPPGSKTWRVLFALISTPF
jgi:hypothetical protein